MATKFTVEQSDITRFPSDLLLLKHARGFHGADAVVARALTASGACAETEISPKLDDYVILPGGHSLAAHRVMFVGAPALRDFSYSQMQHFAARSIEILAGTHLQIRRLSTTIHGVNYGLDASEALQSLVRGFREGFARHPGCQIDEIAFVEKGERTARILKAAVNGIQKPALAARPALATAPRNEASSAIRAEITDKPPKKHVFVAMPFSEDFQDIYEFGIYEPIRKCGYICERVDEPSFTGDILQRIISRIETAQFVVADLTGARANVYLEVGYAWGKGIPVIILAREGEKLHFDVITHRCIFYRTIGQLARELEVLVKAVYVHP